MIDISAVFLELGATIVGLAILARVASRWSVSAIPLYLIAGVAFGNTNSAFDEEKFTARKTRHRLEPMPLDLQRSISPRSRGAKELE